MSIQVGRGKSHYDNSLHFNDEEIDNIPYLRDVIAEADRYGMLTREQLLDRAYEKADESFQIHNIKSKNVEAKTKELENAFNENVYNRLQERIQELTRQCIIEIDNGDDDETLYPELIACIEKAKSNTLQNMVQAEADRFSLEMMKTALRSMRLLVISPLLIVVSMIDHWVANYVALPILTACVAFLALKQLRMFSKAIDIDKKDEENGESS